MRQRVAVVLMLIVDVGFVLWGFMAGVFPNQLPGPGGTPIAAAGYEGYTHGSWAALTSTAPATAGYIEILFRTYGMYNLAFGLVAVAITVTAFRRGERWAWWALLVGNTLTLVSAMIYDKTVNAIGPFEVSEYLGLVFVFGALAITAPFRTAKQPAGQLQ
jgi:hypothetical protein